LSRRPARQCARPVAARIQQRSHQQCLSQKASQWMAAAAVNQVHDAPAPLSGCRSPGQLTTCVLVVAVRDVVTSGEALQGAKPCISPSPRSRSLTNHATLHNAMCHQMITNIVSSSGAVPSSLVHCSVCERPDARTQFIQRSWPMLLPCCRENGGQLLAQASPHHAHSRSSDSSSESHSHKYLILYERVVNAFRTLCTG
jgi:hypothetical protein